MELDDEDGSRHELIDATINIKPNTVAHSIRKLIILLEHILCIKMKIIQVLMIYQ